ncbi:TetR/AcrR family transcriptional regulator [Nonomuraea sp. H19]|uniref:TetR/AcrR family transcriptional regulator n=1 Tax=Nonomuraea sp. H19 TaxID=3452206 RepID=UPI003F8BE3A9
MTDEEIQQRILDAAEECLLQAGPTARIHHLIAERAGVSRPTVYKHIGDQKAVIEALLHRELDRFLTAAQSVLARHGSLRERFIETVVYAVTYAREHALLQKILHEEPQIALPWLTTNADAVFERVVAFMSPHIKRGERDHVNAINPKIVVEWQARLAISLLITPSVTSRLDDPRKLRRYVSDLLDIGLTPDR